MNYLACCSPVSLFVLVGQFCERDPLPLLHVCEFERETAESGQRVARTARRADDFDRLSSRRWLWLCCCCSAAAAALLLIDVAAINAVDDHIGVR